MEKKYNFHKQKTSVNEKERESVSFGWKNSLGVFFLLASFSVLLLQICL